MSRPTQARRQAARPDFAYGALTRSGRPSQTVRLSSRHRRLPRRRPSTPRSSPHAVWAPPRSLAATGGISFDFFSCGYLDGSLPRVSPPHTISFMCGCSPFQVSGLPHSDIPGSWDICSSPGLFAACHVLLRLAAPRHPPWTLFSLDHIALLVFPCSLDVKNPLLLGGRGTRTPDTRLAKPVL